MLPRTCPTTEVTMPCYVRGRADQRTREVPYMLTYASIAKEMSSSTDMMTILENGDYGNSNSPTNLPCYKDNVIAKQCIEDTGKMPLTVAVCMDGVRFAALQAGRSDSILVATIVNLLSQKRHVVGVLRQLDMCRCGCNGWCSVHTYLSYISWIVDSLITGSVPAQKWNGKPWGPSEDRGTDQGVSEFGFRAMLLYVKGDWSEFAKTFGLGSWGKSLNPCP
eukprot:2216875-Pyramimonas_sp.AAC.1